MADLRWWHLGIMGGIGAGSGYALFKDRLGAFPSAGIGAAGTILTVLAFRPGGWLRSSSMGAVRAVRRAQKCRYIKVCDPSPLVPVDQISLMGLGPYIGAGSTVVLKGVARDKWGVLINGTCVVRLGSQILGHSTSAAGKFKVYDLPPGTYKCTFTTSGGMTMTRNLSLPFQGEAEFQF